MYISCMYVCKARCPDMRYFHAWNISLAKCKFVFMGMNSSQLFVN